MAASDSSLSYEELDSELHGKTLRVYWYLLKHSPEKKGVRETQRALGFSSPSVALHHLRKLEDLELVEQTPTGEYVLVQEVKVGFLKVFTRIGKFLLPRYLFYSVLLSTMLLLYALLYFPSSPHMISYTRDQAILTTFFGAPVFLLMYVTSILIISVSCGIMWFETFKTWKEKPFQ